MGEATGDAGGFLNNDPIAGPDEDRFGRRGFVTRLAGVIGGRRDPGSFVLGLYGAWRTGKSSVLNLLEQELRHYRRVGTGGEVVVVRFNPWYFRTLADHLDRPPEGGGAKAARKLGARLQRYGGIASKVVGSVDPLITIATAVAPGGAVIKGIADAVKDGKLEKLGEALAPSAKELEELRAEINAALDAQNRPIVVLMDDIDRLDRGEIQAVFKLVKLTADLRHLTFVLAFDPAIVATALAERYGDARQGAGFLEKIVQVPLHLPDAEPPALQELVTGALDEALEIAGLRDSLTEEDVNRFQAAYARGLLPLLTTPRAAKRFPNAALFALPLPAGEVNPTDHILLEGLRLALPDLYLAIRDRPGVYLKETDLSVLGDEERLKRQREQVEEDLAPLDRTRREAAIAILAQLFPTIEELWRNVSVDAHDPTWQRERRVAAPDYFPRYFQYGIGSSDVADRPLLALFERLPALDTEQVAAELAGMMDGGQEAALINKAHVLDHQVPDTGAAQLAEAVASLAGRYPAGLARRAISLTPMQQAAIVIGRLLQKLPEGAARDDAIGRVVAACPSLPFKIELRRWLRPTDEGGDAAFRVSAAAAAVVQANILAAVRALAERGPLHDLEPEGAAGYYTIWARWGDRDDIRAHLGTAFAADPDGIERFLGCFVAEAPLGGRGLFAEQYDAIARIVEPDWLADHLPHVRDHAEARPGGVTASEQFARLHNARAQAAGETGFDPVGRPADGEDEETCAE